MPSITTWSRLEPNVRGAAQPETLKARIYDPLWLLARQWQLGELQGEDNGTPCPPDCAPSAPSSLATFRRAAQQGR